MLAQIRKLRRIFWWPIKLRLLSSVLAQRNVQLASHFDPLFYRQMILGLEGNMMHLHRTEQLNDANIDRVRRIFVTTLVNAIMQESRPLPSSPH